LESRHFQIAREHVRAGMRKQRLQVEIRLDGELYARYQGRYLARVSHVHRLCRR
jgi:hypothetical protein